MTRPASSCVTDSGLNRRTFLAGATAAAAVSVVQPHLVRGSQANSKIRLGLVGCGGRGTWIARLFAQHGGYEIVGAADYFADKAAAFGGQLKVPAERQFSGLSAYKRLLDTKPDAIAIESPPFFHPEHAAAGIDAGCHVYLAKPIAVDVPGCVTVEQSGAKATQKKLCLVVDFQTRTSEFYQEAVRRAHAGDLGPLVSGEAVYYCGPTWGGADALKSDPQNPELRLRSWGRDRVLSGDIITEQNIHALDVATWIVNAAPQKAWGTCGGGGRDVGGDCNDHFAVIYTFPKDVIVSFASKQYGSGFDDIGVRMYGPLGTLESHYFGAVYIHGQKSYKGGKHGNLYTDGAVANIATFHNAIVKGDYSNSTVAPSVRSNLTTILGRIAAYRRAEVSWDEMLKANEKLPFPVERLKA